MPDEPPLPPRPHRAAGLETESRSGPLRFLSGNTAKGVGPVSNPQA